MLNLSCQCKSHRLHRLNKHEQDQQVVSYANKRYFDLTIEENKKTIGSSIFCEIKVFVKVIYHKH